LESALPDWWDFDRFWLDRGILASGSTGFYTFANILLTIAGSSILFF
jgi:hypothetical protein